MIFEKIRSILGEQFNIEPSSITYETDFIEDLNADSLDIIDLFSRISGEFNVKADMNLLSDLKTVGDVVKYIESQP